MTNFLNVPLNEIYEYEKDEEKDEINTNDNKEQLKKLEKELLELNKLMSSMNEMVICQRPEIENIDSNIESVYTNVENGVDELEQAEIIQKRTRYRTLKVISGAMLGGALSGGIGLGLFGYSVGLVGSSIGTGIGGIMGTFM